MDGIRKVYRNGTKKAWYNKHLKAWVLQGNGTCITHLGKDAMLKWLNNKGPVESFPYDPVKMARESIINAARQWVNCSQYISMMSTCVPGSGEYNKYITMAKRARDKAQMHERESREHAQIGGVSGRNVFRLP